MKHGVGTKEIVCLVCDSIVSLEHTLNTCEVCGKKFLADGTALEDLCPIELENLDLSQYWEGGEFPLFDDTESTVAEIRRRESRIELGLDLGQEGDDAYVD